MSLRANLIQMERQRELYWTRYPVTTPPKLRWRALTVRHSFHVLPGESILELGAGSGIWTEYLAQVLKGENPITAAVFNRDLHDKAVDRDLPNTKFVLTEDLLKDYPPESFDYIVGTSIICHNLYPQNLHAVQKLLKPGGRFFFFEANYWNPQVLLKSTIPGLGRWAGNAECQVALRKYRLLEMASHQGFTHIDVTPYDIIHPRTPAWLLDPVRNWAWVMEHAPGVREFCGTLYITGQKPGDEAQRRPQVDLAFHPDLFDAVSVVVPCHNEEMNVPPLFRALKEMYGPYIHEFIAVDDNSTDRTREVCEQLAQEDPRVKVVARTPPNGVGRALRDGYAAATGRYILTMDCDFVRIVPELRDLFKAVTNGYDGAIGSRFSHESVLINYPFFKIVCNRAFHVLVRMFLERVRDVSNNLKLYRADILKNLEIEEPHFAANAETGLKPILAGHKIAEVPISWINRTVEMGNSSFRIVKVAPNYAGALFRILWKTRRNRKALRAQAAPDNESVDRLDRARS
jgi:SAM-dependent methyltransferase